MGTGEEDGLGETVGMLLGFADKSSVSEALETTRVLVAL